jgi:hypothetical protein
LIKDLPPCKELIERTIKEAEELLDTVRKKIIS